MYIRTIVPSYKHLLTAGKGKIEVSKGFGGLGENVPLPVCAIGSTTRLFQLTYADLFQHLSLETSDYASTYLIRLASNRVFCAAVGNDCLADVAGR